MDTFKDYMNSFLGILIILIGLIAIPEIRQKRKYWILSIALSIVLFYLGIDKINRDNTKDLNNEAIQKNLQSKLTMDSLNLDSAKRDLRSINAYLINLEAKGIRRDSATNQPRIETKSFTNYINSVGTLEQH